MRSYRYVKLDPTGNMTCLVLDPASPEDARAYRERRRANQLAEMRQATGTKPRRQRSAQERAAAQVKEMRKAAGGAGK